MNRLKDITDGFSVRDGLLAAGYALYLMFSFAAFHSATLLSPASVGHEAGVYFSSGAMVGRIATGVIAAAIVYGLLRAGRMPRARAVTWVLVGVCVAFALVGALLLAMIFQFAPAVDEGLLLPWFVLAGGLLGCADLTAVLLWARFSATLSLRTVYVYVTLCHGASLLLYGVFTLVSPVAVLPLAMLVFLVSAICAKRALDVQAGEEDFGFEEASFRQLATGLWPPVLGTAILCFMGGIMLQISGQQDIPLGEFQQTSLWASAAAVVCLLVPALFVRKPLNLGKVYSVALPVSAAGFLLLPLIWNAAGGIVNAFAQVGAMVASLILWCMMADGARRTRTSPVLLFSLAFSVMNIASLAGTIIGFANASRIHQGDLALTTVALVSVYLLLMAALVLFRNRESVGRTPVGLGPDCDGEGAEGEAEECATAPSPEEALAARCDALAESFGLTPREGDIFLLLAQGHTLPVVSQRLFVSENTVKSHAKRIYQKLGIHSRAELIDLVNGSSDESVG